MLAAGGCARCWSAGLLLLVQPRDYSMSRRKLSLNLLFPLSYAPSQALALSTRAISCLYASILTIAGGICCDSGASGTTRRHDRLHAPVRRLSRAPELQ